MYRAIVPEGEFECARYELQDAGVELYTEADEHIAFVPFANLHAIINDEVHQEDDDEMSVM